MNEYVILWITAYPLDVNRRGRVRRNLQNIRHRRVLLSRLSWKIRSGEVWRVAFNGKLHYELSEPLYQLYYILEFCVTILAVRVSSFRLILYDSLYWSVHIKYFVANFYLTLLYRNIRRVCYFLCKMIFSLARMRFDMVTLYDDF